MRYYGFCNFMLSSVQQGVQNFHVCHELFNKYDARSQLAPHGARSVLREWSTSHKTAIFLNGGNAIALRSVYAQLADFGDELCLPYAKFHEDEDSLDNLMTACGIVVPTSIVDMAQAFRNMPVNYNLDRCGSNTDIALASFLNQFQLAR